MSNSVIWKKTFDTHSKGEPWTFVTGIHHAVPNHYYCPAHSHNAVEVVYHPSGRGNTRLGQHRIDFDEGSAVVYGQEEVHDQTMTAKGDDLCVQVALPKKLRSRLPGGFFVPRISHPWLVEEIRHLCLSQAQPGGLNQRIFDMRATAVLLAVVNIAAETSRKDSLAPSERHVLQAEHFIAEHFSTLDALEVVAQHVGISHDHLRHIFKEQRGKSLIRHVSEIKVGRAKILLANSPVPLKQIATQCGFKDEYYFSAVFRRLTNLSPGAYRQRMTADLRKDR